MNEVLILSNPHGRGRGMLASALSTLKDGAVGAVGALGVDIAYGYAKGFLPAPLQAGYGRTASKLALAVLGGIVTDKVFRGRGKQVAVGSATVTLHEAFKDLSNQFAPTLPVGAYEDVSGYDPAQLVDNRTGAYMPTGAYMRQPAGALNGDNLPM